MALTNNGLSLYFTSNRPGSYGNLDIWVAQRASVGDPWGPHQDVGPTINAGLGNHSQRVTEDGHWMYFTSNRSGGLGGMDVWRSYRADTHDDFAWQEPQNLGPNVNSSMAEACPFPFEDPQTGLITLYFASNRAGGQGWDIYANTQEPDGSFDPAVPVPELNSPGDEKHFSVRPDGLMGILASNRQGSFGDLDLWVTSRASTHDPWSTPVNMGPTINTAGRDAMPAWAPDGRTLFFESDRDGGYGGTDLYSTTWQPDTWTVTSIADTGPGSLRQTIAAAFSGDRIVFDPSLKGQMITLTSGQLAISKSLDVEGLGADRLATSGNHASRIFNISGGVTVTIAGLTITAGLGLPGATGPGSGGGIENTGSHLTVADDTFSDNEARGSGGNGNGRGGAIDSVSGATLTVTHCLFLHNLSTGSSAAASGAIETDGAATVSDSTFIGNQSIGGSDGTSGFSRGGAIYNSAGTLTITNSTFIDNQALGGSNNTGGGSASTLGQAIGGAIANTDQAVLFVTGSRFSGNLARGGSNNTSTGGMGNVGVGNGGALFSVGRVTVTDSTFENNEARGGNDNRGDVSSFQFVGTAWGGAISSTASNTSGDPVILTLQNVMIRGNRAIGGDGNTDGTYVGISQGGAITSSGQRFFGPPAGSTTTISNSTIADNEAIGGQGAAGQSGGDARGGGIANFFGAVLTVSGSTVTGNRAIGGAGGDGASGGNGIDGGVFNDAPSTAPTNPGAPNYLTMLDSALADNEAHGGGAGDSGSSAGLGAGGGIASAGILTILASSLEDNRALGHDGDGGADGGDGLGGGLYVAGGTASILTTVIDHNRAVGGDGDAGSNGGNGLGGGVSVGAGTVIVSASEISSNQALGGVGDGAGTDGPGVGGGVYNLGTFLFDVWTVIAQNHASTSHDDRFGC